MKQKFYTKKKRFIKNSNNRIFYFIYNFKLFRHCLRKLKDLSKIEFMSEKNESLKNTFNFLISDGTDKNAIFSKLIHLTKNLLKK